MLQSIIPKLPMRDKVATKDYYINQLGFTQSGGEYDSYLMLKKGGIELHFFEFKALDLKENYGQVYIRVNGIAAYYQSLVDQGVAIHPNAPLESKPWGQKEFSLLDPDNNLLTFGQGV